VAIFFRRFRTSAEVMGSLFIGGADVRGGALVDLKINFFNFIVYPITFGIAVDYGANVAARARERGGEVSTRSRRSGRPWRSAPGPR